MINDEGFLKKIQCRQVLRNNIYKFKEAFILYYGEDKRDLIEEKFSKALFIACLSPDALESTIRELKEVKSNEIIDRIMTSSETVLTKEDLFGDFSFEYSNLFPINNYIEFMKLYELGEDGRKKMFIDNGFDYICDYIKDITMDEYMDMVNSGKILEKYQNISPIIKNNLEYYINIKKENIKYEDLFNKIKNIF